MAISRSMPVGGDVAAAKISAISGDDITTDGAAGVQVANAVKPSGVSFLCSRAPSPQQGFLFG